MPSENNLLKTNKNETSCLKKLCGMSDKPVARCPDASVKTKNSTKEEASDTMDTSKSSAAHFDEVLQLAGGVGRWQLLLLLWMSTVFFIASFGYLGLMFLGATPEFRCADDYPENFTFHEIPKSVSRCYRASGAPCQRWRYDLDTDGDGEDDAETVVSKWDLVCDRKPMLSMLQSAFQGGGLVGSQVAGQLGDRLGRRVVYIAMSFIYVAAPLATTIVGSYELYFVLRFMLGLGWVGVVNTGFVLTVELSGRKWRTINSQLLMLPNSLGQMVLPLLAYCLRRWWQLQLALTAPFVLYILNIWAIPDSPRWLILQGRDDEAIRVLNTASRVNGKERPDDAALRTLFQNMRQCKQTEVRTGQGDSLITFLRSATLRKWTAVTGICWFAIGCGYYGLQFDVSQLSASPYLACALLGLVEVPAYFSAYVLDRFGRRPMTVGTLTLSGVIMLLFTVRRDPVVWLVLGLIGKLLIGSAFVMVFNYTPEYMPTTVRAIGFGFASVCSQTGAMVSPFIVDLLRDIDEIVPSVVFGCGCVLAGVLALNLPETVGRNIPDTVAEVESGELSLPADRASYDKEGAEGSSTDAREKEGGRLSNPLISTKL